MCAALAAQEESLTLDESNTSLLRYWQPRYWPAWLLIGWFRLNACLPWSVALRINGVVGRVLWLMMGRHRQVVVRSIASCCPELANDEVDRLVRSHFEELGKCLAETAFAWCGRVDADLAPFRIEGEHHVRQALAGGKGVVLCTGHFTPLEMCGPRLKAMFPLFGFMFHRRRNALLNEFQRRGRRYCGHLAFASNDVKAMLSALRQNAVVWYAADQHSAGRSSTSITFFGQTMQFSTAPARIAAISGAAIVPFTYQRLPNREGYCLRFEPPVDWPGEADALAVTMRINEALEAGIRRCPEQYLWTHQFLKQRLPRWSLSEDSHEGKKKLPSAHENHSWRWTDLASLIAIGAVALFITVADNGAFFSSVFNATVGDPHRFGILSSLSALVFGTLAITLALVPTRRLLGIVAALLLVISATVDYFMRYFGVVFDPSMIRNVLETDAREASGLISADLFIHVLGFGVLPAVLVLFFLPGRSRWGREVAVRFGTAIAALMIVSGPLYANLGPVSYFSHERHALRMQINPLYPIYALAQYETRERDTPPVERQHLAGRRVDEWTARKPTLLVFVMGETARADRFSLNGYSRPTNRYTQDSGVVNFADVTSCGTSTADSVPCIFSWLGHDEFSHSKFAIDESMMQMLARLGVSVWWRDNSTGCKKVCDSETFEDLAGADDPDHCAHNICVDEILLDGLDALVRDASRDRFIVLHQRGSHGPEYFTDTPKFAKAWLPECDTSGLHDCDAASINNAYDNTILYTDYVLSRVIAFLESQSDRYQVAMLYVSDHGESLGESGLYLHGYPYALAPREQTEVPMLLWASAGFYSDQGIDQQCLRESATEPVSHDFVFHTLLPIFRVSSSLYRPELDLLAKCRRVPTVHHPGY